MKNLYTKIYNVMSDIKPVIKDKTNDFHKYKYASDMAVISEVREAMIKHKLIAIPSQKECKKEADLTTLVVEYELIDVESGESMKSLVFGWGLDKGDKGGFKAATSAEKYFFLKTFLIPTMDDPESDNTTDYRDSKEIQKVKNVFKDVTKEGLGDLFNDDIEEPIAMQRPSLNPSPEIMFGENSKICVDCKKTFQAKESYKTRCVDCYKKSKNKKEI